MLKFLKIWFLAPDTKRFRFIISGAKKSVFSIHSLLCYDWVDIKKIAVQIPAYFLTQNYPHLLHNWGNFLSPSTYMSAQFSPRKWHKPYRNHFPSQTESLAGIQLSHIAPGLLSLAFSTTTGIGIALWLLGIDSEGRKWLVLMLGGWYAFDYLPNLVLGHLKKTTFSKKVFSPIGFFFPRECTSKQRKGTHI